MPIYEYECSDCGNICEILVRSHSTNIKCPKCDGSNMKKLITASYSIRMNGMSDESSACCGRDERCSNPPCESGGICCGSEAGDNK